MDVKIKYMDLMQRYFEGETSPAEEKDLAVYVASSDDPAFDELRGTLGFLSIGREIKKRKIRNVRFYSIAAAACAVGVLCIGLSAKVDRAPVLKDGCIGYYYGEKIENTALVMNSIDASLADFFGAETPAQTNLTEMFKR